MPKSLNFRFREGGYFFLNCDNTQLKYPQKWIFLFANGIAGRLWIKQNFAFTEKTATFESSIRALDMLQSYRMLKWSIMYFNQACCTFDSSIHNTNSMHTLESNVQLGWFKHIILNLSIGKLIISPKLLCLNQRYSFFRCSDAISKFLGELRFTVVVDGYVCNLNKTRSVGRIGMAGVSAESSPRRAGAVRAAH